MKTIKSLIAVLFLLVGSQAFAQTGTSPYVGANHDYYVNSADGLTHDVGHTGNTYYWYLTDNLDVDVTAPDVYTAGQAWGTLASPISNLFKIGITWGSDALGNTYHLYVKEFSSSNCISTRKMTITVNANNFDITLAAAPVTSCNSVSGNVFTGATPGSGELATTTKVFTVQASGTVNSWKFKPLISDDNGNTATATYKYNDGAQDQVLTLASDYITVPASGTPYDVVVTVTVDNIWNSNNTSITINIDEGQDVLYGTLEKDEVGSATYAATATTTINALPLTTEISTN